MTFSRPWFRFRRVHSELFEEGFPRRVRQHFSLELGMQADVRSQIADLKQEVTRLRAEVARHQAVAAMAGLAAPAPAAIGTRLRGAAPQRKIAARPASLLPVREPDRPLVRPLPDDAREVIVLIADKNWP